MPARRKTLDELVADRSFLARRKHHLQLLNGPLVRDPALRAIQRAFQEEESNAEAYLLAQQFERQVRSGKQAPQPTLAHLLHASLGPDPVAFARRGLSNKQTELLGVEWQAWDVLYGLAWRAREEMLNNVDLCALAAGRVDVARVDRQKLPAAGELPALLEEFWTRWEKDKPRRDRLWREWRAKRGYPELEDDEIPAPPGFELVA